ncbi:hypothetical protein XarbCFBP8152_15865 [Xanthomonas arboricola]|nr:hypothetical protein XarbCFBP8152_15865 [Xanthomonas arboricola]
MGGQGPVEIIVTQGCEQSMRCVARIASLPISFPIQPEQQAAFHTCPLTVAGPYAAWMPPPSLQGRTCGVSRER